MMRPESCAETMRSTRTRPVSMSTSTSANCAPNADDRRLLRIRSAASLADDHHVAELLAHVAEEHAACRSSFADLAVARLEIARRRAPSSSGGGLEQRVARFSAATRTAGPTDAVVIEPHEFDANGSRSVSPRIGAHVLELARRATSAAICANTVRAPVPRSCAPVSTSIVPSRLMRTVAYAGGPPPAPQVSDAIPTPRRSAIVASPRLRDRARSQPKRSAPSA